MYINSFTKFGNDFLLIVYMFCRNYGCDKRGVEHMKKCSILAFMEKHQQLVKENNQLRKQIEANK